MSTDDIFTQGDDGMTSINGSNERLLKNDCIFNAIGSVDELRSAIVLILALLKEEENDETDELFDHLNKAANVLTKMNKAIANTYNDSSTNNSDFSVCFVEDLNESVNIELSEDSDFNPFIKADSVISAHMSHTVNIARRAERDLVDACQSYSIKQQRNLIGYLNRLSVLLSIYSVRYDAYVGSYARF